VWSPDCTTACPLSRGPILCLSPHLRTSSVAVRAVVSSILCLTSLSSNDRVRRILWARGRLPRQFPPCSPYSLTSLSDDDDGDDSGAVESLAISVDLSSPVWEPLWFFLSMSNPAAPSWSSAAPRGSSERAAEADLRWWVGCLAMWETGLQRVPGNYELRVARANPAAAARRASKQVGWWTQPIREESAAQLACLHRFVD
jgi:hypothetical protein